MILIDDRAGSKELIRYTPLSNPSLACLCQLGNGSHSSADVCFTGKGPEGNISIGIEYKSLSDLLTSIHSGRLQSTQFQSMSEEYDICVLLYYGQYRCGSNGSLEIYNPSIIQDKGSWYWYVKGIPYQGPYPSKDSALTAQRNDSRGWSQYTHIGGKPIPYGYLESALISCSRVGVWVKHLTRPEDCAQWIGVMYRSWQKEYTSHKFFRTFDKSSNKSPALMPGFDPALKQKLDFAKEFPGMGFERALAAARYFPSAQDMFNAEVGDWMKVPGIGKVIAKSAVHAARRKTGTVETETVDSDSPNLSAFEE